MKLIGINGFKRSGKDTVCQIMQDSFHGVQRIAFADNLKIMAAKTLGYNGTNDELIERMDRFKDSGIVNAQMAYGDAPVTWDTTFLGDPATIRVQTGREFLQKFGTNAREIFGEDFWVDQILPCPVEHVPGMEHLDHVNANRHLLWQMYPTADFVCVTDVRFPNEAKRIRDLGGEVWRIVRPDTESDGHASEQPLSDDLIDRQIENDGWIIDLETKVWKAVVL